LTKSFKKGTEGEKEKITSGPRLGRKRAVAAAPQTRGRDKGKSPKSFDRKDTGKQKPGERDVSEHPSLSKNEETKYWDEKSQGS